MAFKDIYRPVPMEILDQYQDKRPPLFEGISRVLTASVNPIKVEAMNAWFKELHIVNGSTELAAQPLDVVGREPEWHSAVKVSRHKVESLVTSLRGEPGGPAVCFGSDVVFWLQDKPLLNLSRKNDLTKSDLNEAVVELQRIFSKETIARWDVALSASSKNRYRKYVRATVADVIQVKYAPIEGTLIHELFYEDIPGALGRNARLPLIDDLRLQQYIKEIRILPVQSLIEQQSGELKGDGTDLEYGWTWCCGESGFETIRDVVSAEILGGLPRRRRLDELVKLSPGKASNSHWKLI